MTGAVLSKVIYAAAGGVVAALLFAPRACAPQADPAIIEKLVKKGFAVPGPERPVIRDIPRTVIREVVLQGRIDPVPHEPGMPWPQVTDLGLECRCELVREGDVILGRIIGSAWLQDIESRELIRRGPETFPDAKLAISKEIERFARDAPWPRWEIRAGASIPGLAVRVGATRYFTKRIGAWADLDVPVAAGANARASVGLALRF